MGVLALDQEPLKEGGCSDRYSVFSEIFHVTSFLSLNEMEFNAVRDLFLAEGVFENGTLRDHFISLLESVKFPIKRMKDFVEKIVQATSSDRLGELFVDGKIDDWFVPITKGVICARGDAQNDGNIKSLVGKCFSYIYTLLHLTHHVSLNTFECIFI